LTGFITPRTRSIHVPRKLFTFAFLLLDIMVYIWHIRSQLSKVLTSAYPHISIRVVFRPSCRLSSFFPFKDRIPIALRSHVVYQFTCQCCNALYVGQTRRHINTRISEHMGVSPLTGKERPISTMSSILAHKHMHKHPVSASDFKILSSGTASEWDLLIRESLLISQLKVTEHLWVLILPKIFLLVSMKALD
jgi:hypothetical protein